MSKNKKSVLLIYTGGTIGMMQDPISGQLKPFVFSALSEQIPELKKFDIKISAISFDKPIDSSNMNPEIWIDLAELIKTNYNKFDGFVVLHGSDTMAFTASALSFMFENLSKPIILTGSQLPIGIIRTDGKENLITAIEIAAAHRKDKPIVSEVAIYFEYCLYRGNRSHKFNSEHFDAFKSPNYPRLAEAGVNINYNYNSLAKASNKKLVLHNRLDNNIAVLKLFPGITLNTVEAVLNTKGIKAVVLETYGSGNCSTDENFIQLLNSRIKQGLIIYNVTQCNAGSVVQGKYETSALLNKIGVIGGADITTEAAVTKLMHVLGLKKSLAETKKMLSKNLRGEISISE